MGEYTAFPYELLPQMYDQALSVMMLEEGVYYKKILLKRIAGHLAQFGKRLEDSTLNALCGIALA